MSRASQRLGRAFERRYLTALVLLACVTTAAFVTSYRLTSIESERARVVILATEQRAVSQRIAFLVKAIDQKPDPARVADLRVELDTNIDRMRRAHEILAGTSRDDRVLRRFVEPLNGIYFGGYISFDNRVRQFLQNARIVAATSPFSSEWVLAAPLRNEIVVSATNSMMQTHGLMVMILEAEARRDVALSKLVDIVGWLSILAMLLLVTFIIFRPMQRQIVNAIETVEGEKNRADAAEAKAVAANDARGSFFQSASHELRTPLNAILGMSDVIRAKEIDEIEQELEHISSAGDHLLALLNNILDAHKLSQGQLTAEQKPFEIAQTLERVAALAESLAAQKDLGFEADVDIPKGLMVNGDGARVEQVLVNIVDNAARFTEEGSVSVHAHVESDAPETSNLHVAVTDSGIGISPEKIAEIFERNTATPVALARNGGLGIGLSVAKDLAEVMGGSIDVQSTVGEGTKVIISLPFDVAEGSVSVSEDANEDVSPKPAPQADEPEAPAPAPVAAKAGFVRRHRSFRALIVDDNMANRMVAEALLKPLGAESEMAVDGRQAVAKAEKQEFDLIFMDISMPVMDGIEATIAIRAGTGPCRKTPIIALTAHVDIDEFGSLRDQGFQDIITKPVRKETLVRALDRWLDAESDTVEDVA